MHNPNNHGQEGFRAVLGGARGLVGSGELVEERSFRHFERAVGWEALADDLVEAFGEEGAHCGEEGMEEE